MRSRDWVHGVRIANYPQGRIHLRRARGLGAADGFICTSANGEELIEDKLNPAVKGGRRVVYPVLGLPVGQYPPPAPHRFGQHARASLTARAKREVLRSSPTPCRWRRGPPNGVDGAGFTVDAALRTWYI